MRTALILSERREVEDSLGAIRREFTVSEMAGYGHGNILRKVQGFRSDLADGSHGIVEAFRVKSAATQCILFFVKFETVIKPIRPHAFTEGSHIVELYPFVYCETKHGYGRTYIRPEKIADKFFELLASVEIDFDSHGEFSRKYYVITDREDEVRKQFDHLKLETINGHVDLHLEFIGNTCLISDRKRLHAGSVSKIVSTAMLLLKNGL